MKMKNETLTGYPSIDKPWLKYYDQEYDEVEIPQKSIYQLALDYNMQNMKKIALDLRSSANDYNEQFKITYETFFEQININAKASSAIGIKANDIIPMILPNIPEARTLLYSNSVIGAISYPISFLLPSNQLESLLLENDVKTIFIYDAFFDKYKEAIENSKVSNVIYLGERKLFSNQVNIFHWNVYQSYSQHIKENLVPFYEDDHIAAIIGTSGTTGSPKGVCLTDRNINATALSYINGNLFNGSVLDVLLPSIAYGLSMLHMETISGKYVYIVPELLTVNTPKVLCKLKPDNFFGGPVHYIHIKDSEEFKLGKIPKRNVYVSGGATLPKSVERELNGIDEGYSEKQVNDSIIVRQGYGMSETCALGTISKRGAYKFGSVGIPMVYTTISIFKPGTDEELGYDENGEICITGPNIMREYLKNLDETSNTIIVHRDGKKWVHTKDIGYMDREGHLYHVDRIKNIFMRTGFKVHPDKIAEFLDTIPYVKRAVVIGYEHPKEQCVPVAFLELDESALSRTSKETLLEDINAKCYLNLEEPSIPVNYIVLDSIPINLGGKIDIQKLKIDYRIDFKDV